MNEKLTDCPLTDAELIEAVLTMNAELARTGGKTWRMHIPVDLRRDSDILIAEIARRFRDVTQDHQPQAQGTILEPVRLPTMTADTSFPRQGLQLEGVTSFMAVRMSQDGEIEGEVEVVAISDLHRLITPVQPSAVVSLPDIAFTLADTLEDGPELLEAAKRVYALQLPQPVAPQFYTLPDLGNQPVAPCPDCEGDTEFGLCETCGSRGHTQPVAPVQGGGVEFGEPSAWMWQGPHGTACGVNNPFEDDSPEFQRKHGVVALYCKSDLTTTQSAPGTPSTRPVAFMAPDGQFERLSEGCDPDQYRGWTPLYGAPSVGSVPRDDNHVKNVINGWKKSWSVKLSSRAEGALRDRIEKLLTSRTEGK